MTVLYSVLHFLVDGVCSWAMLGRLAGGMEAYLLYNFCAFALQLPLGALLDRLGGKRTPLIFAGVGCVLTLLGAFTGPAVLGLGNAAFHVGGGVDVIRDGGRRDRLGIFVAPGAMGLYFGGLLAGKMPWLLLPVAALMTVLLCLVRSPGEISTAPSQKMPVSLFLCCFLVVVLRSFVGFQVVFPWKSGALAFGAVCAVVRGDPRLRAAGAAVLQHDHAVDPLRPLAAVPGISRQLLRQPDSGPVSGISAHLFWGGYPHRRRFGKYFVPCAFVEGGGGCLSCLRSVWG